MNKYIDHEAAINAALLAKSDADITLVPGLFTNGFIEGAKIKENAILNALADVPAADVVEVVRCGECMFWDAPPSCEGLARCRTGESGVRFRNASDFCSRGERKGGEE